MAKDLGARRNAAPLLPNAGAVSPGDLNPNVSEVGLEPIAYADSLCADFPVGGRW
jgi:hypothetical protein